MGETGPDEKQEEVIEESQSPLYMDKPKKQQV